TFSPALAAGSEVTVTGTDVVGNADSATGSVPADITYVGGDDTAPAITDVVVSQQDSSNPADGVADQTVVTFTADDANATYTVASAGATATILDLRDGLHTATFSPALAAGSEVTVTGTDVVGNAESAT